MNEIIIQRKINTIGSYLWNLFKNVKHIETESKRMVTKGLEWSR